MVKLIALDMDGTLMSADHVTVSEENSRALKEAHEKGVKIAISTGRTLSIIGDVCQQVPEIDYVMYSNGAAVYDRRAGKDIYKNLMSWEFCEPIIRYLDSNPLMSEVYADGKSYLRNDRYAYLKPDLFPKVFLETVLKGTVLCDDVCDLLKGKDIEKFTLHFDDEETLERVEKRLLEEKNIALTTSFKSSLEFTDVTADKGTALAGMCKVLGITPDECMAFGDANNDLPMLELAGYSFAMANGTPECKAAAKYETKSNAEDGVAFGIRKFI